MSVVQVGGDVALAYRADVAAVFEAALDVAPPPTGRKPRAAAEVVRAVGSLRDSPDAVARRIHVGDGRVVDAVRGRGAGVGLVGLGARRPRADLGRRQRVRRRATPRTSRCSPSLGLTPPPAVDRVGAHRARARACTTTRPIAHYRDVLARRPRRRASCRGSACTTSRCRAGSPTTGGFLVERNRTERLGPPRRLRRRDVRRPRRRLAAGQRDELLRPRRLPRPAAGRPATTTATSAAVADEAIHLATAEAARAPAQTGAPVSSIFGLSADRRAGRRRRRRRGMAERLHDDLLGARARPVPRRRAAGAAAASRSSGPTSPARFDLIGFSYYAAMGVARRPRSRSTRPTRRCRRSATASGPTASGWCSTGCTPSCPARRCSSPSTASAPTTTTQRAALPRARARGRRTTRSSAASTCAASSTGPASTTTSGSTATTSPSASSTATATCARARAVLQREARP